MKIIKKIVAVAPFQHPDNINFKTAAYKAWMKIGGATAISHYPPRILHSPAFRWELPTLHISCKEARLRFVEPISIKFDTFPDYARYEIIPMVWDCWPSLFEETCAFFKRHKVKTAFFTSSQTAERMRLRFPDMNIFYIPEGIDTSLYHAGKELKDRQIDLLEFGRGNEQIVKYELPNGINHLHSSKDKLLFKNNTELFDSLANSKITISLPRCDTQPEKAGDIETLTQRYWESMLSRIIMVGRAPQELTNLIGYNPVVDLDIEYPNEQIVDILAHLDNYQVLVDRNREIALNMGDWKIRMRQVMELLKKCGYTT